MPIRGLTDTARAVFPVIGKLRKGGPRPESGNRPGPDLDHWRFVTDRPEILDAFERAYGEEPRDLDIYLPYARVEDNFTTWKEAWSAGGLRHRCDGEVCTVWLQEDGTYSTEPVACPGGCKEVGRLSVILPALLRIGHVGAVTMETQSLNDIMAIQGALLATVEARNHEDLRGIGFRLRRVRQRISTPGKNGRRIRRDKWLVKLEPAAIWIRAQLQAAEARALLPDGAATKQLDQDGLQSPQIIDPRTGEAVGQEYMDGKYAQAERGQALPQHTPLSDVQQELYGDRPVINGEFEEGEEPVPWSQEDWAKLRDAVAARTLSSKKWREMLGLPESAEGKEVKALGTVAEVIALLEIGFAKAVAGEAVEQAKLGF